MADAKRATFGGALVEDVVNSERDSASVETDAGRIRRESETEEPSLLADFLDFLRTNKKWWLVPLLLSLAVIGLLAAVGGSPLGPFIYPMF